MPGPVRLAIPLIGPFFNSPAEGARPTLMAATDPTIDRGDDVGPRRRGETSGPAVQVGATSTARDEDLARQLRDVSVEMTGIAADIA